MAGNNKKSTKTSKSKVSKSGTDGAAEAALAATRALPADQQVAALTTHYAELMAQQAQLKSQLSTAVSRYEAAEKSRDQLNTDYTKAMLSKAQLESLCRELQKQNKITKEENIARIREEEEKRREVSARLNTTLSDITIMMQQNTEKNAELRLDNQAMADKLSEIMTQHDARQQYLDKMLKQRDLQLQLAEAKMAKTAIEATEERETFLKDKKKMLEDLQSYQEKITRMAATEIALRTQLTKYTEQYDSFRTTVETSNTIMNKFKKEMDGMTKKIKKLERETLTWQTKWQKSNAALLDMVSERTNLFNRLDKVDKQNAKLQQLARTMQQQLVLERKERKGEQREEGETCEGEGNETSTSETVKQEAEHAPATTLETELPGVPLEPKATAPVASITVMTEPAGEMAAATLNTCSAQDELLATSSAVAEARDDTSAHTEKHAASLQRDTLNSEVSVDTLEAAGDATTEPEKEETADKDDGDEAQQLAGVTRQLTDIQAKLAELVCDVKASGGDCAGGSNCGSGVDCDTDSGLDAVATKESTIEITEL